MSISMRNFIVFESRFTELDDAYRIGDGAILETSFGINVTSFMGGD